MRVGAAILRADGQILKGKVAQAVLLRFGCHMEEDGAVHIAVAEGNMVGIGQGDVLPSAQVVELQPGVDVQEAGRLAGHVFKGDVLIMLGGIRAHFEHEHIAHAIHRAAADKHVAVMHALRAAGQHAVAEAICAVLHQDALVAAVVGIGICPGSLAALEHH